MHWKRLICLPWVPETEWNGDEAIFEEILAKNFSKLMQDINPHIEMNHKQNVYKENYNKIYHKWNQRQIGSL